MCVKCFSDDVCIYSTCAFLIVMLLLMYAFIVFVLFSYFLLICFNCHVDVDVDNVQRGEHVVKTLRGIAI